MSLERLPADTLYEIFFQIDLEQLGRLCQSSRKMKQVCTNEEFWKRKYIKDFKSRPDDSNFYFSWRDEYNQEYWKQRFIRDYGYQPERLVFPTWKEEYNALRPFESFGYVFLIYINAYDKNPLLILRGTEENLYNRLAVILNTPHELTHRENFDLRKLLHQAYDYYRRRLKSTNTITMKLCLEIKKDNPNVVCNPRHHPVELPIDGETLKIILAEFKLYYPTMGIIITKMPLYEI